MYIFTFYKKDNDNKNIHIIALSYLEAKYALLSLNNYANYIYNLLDYKREQLLTYEVHIKELCSILNIGEDYLEYPIFINEKQYKQLKRKTWCNKYIKTNVEHNFEQSDDPIINKINAIIDHPNYNSFIPTYGQRKI